MTAPVLQDHAEAKTRVLDGLAQLRAEFPLEQRVLEAAPAVRAAYAQLLRRWLRAPPPPSTAIDHALLAQLTQLDAVVPEEHGLGCYPFSSVDTGIHVTLPGGAVNAMCAIDALAIARLARAHVHINAACEACGASIGIEVEANGGLDHDQADAARVVWQRASTTQGPRSQGLCHRIRFLCRSCPEAQTGEHFTLPQAAAMGNAFFRFQSALLAAHADQVACPP